MLKVAPQIIVIVCVVFLTGVFTVSAKTWTPLSYEDLIKQSDLIVTGKVIWINNQPVSTNSKDEATIMVDEVLQGKLTGNMVGLVYPGVNKGFETYDGKFTSTRTYNEVFFDIEQEGIWFLQKRGDKFYINHPARFKPEFFLSKVKEYLKK